MRNITKEQLYQRQTTLSEIGITGQKKLMNAKVLVVGCGGLGSAVAVYLAASGIGTIHLIDHDAVDVSNLHRQVFYKSEDIGKPKTEILSQHIQLITPFIKVSTSNYAISKENIFDELDTFDIILDCTDSLPIKYLLNDACVLKDKTLIYGSLYKFDGYVSTFNHKLKDGAYSANLRDAFPKLSKEKIPNCSEIGTLNTIVGIIALMQANEVLKVVTEIGKPLYNQLLIYNSLDNTQYKMKLKKSFSKQMIQQLFEIEKYDDIYCSSVAQDEKMLITARQLKNDLSIKSNNDKINIISVIEDTNTQLPFKVNLKMPFSFLKNKIVELDSNKKHILVCKKGILSYVATQLLKERYPDLNILSLKKGIENY
jgi:adenylyltransferase/sulfurtransferase